MHNKWLDYPGSVYQSLALDDDRLKKDIERLSRRRVKLLSGKTMTFNRDVRRMRACSLMKERALFIAQV